MSYKFFQNKECPYFPCHGSEEQNCLFCYCPLYFIKCPGNCSYTKEGIKDCSGCSFPHKKENYDKVLECIKAANREICATCTKEPVKSSETLCKLTEK